MIGPTEMMIIGAIIVLLFGAAKLPELARSVGKSMGEFKRAQKEAELDLKKYEQSLNGATAEEKEGKVQKMAKDLGVKTEGKTEDELLDEIQDILSKREHVD